jgi:predicted phage tail component-like protein
MGFKFNNTHSDTFNICVRTESIPCIAPRRHTVITVPGRDGQYVFEEAYDNVKLKFNCNIVDEPGVSRPERAREISAWLANTGVLILDQDPDVQYKVVKSVSGIDSIPRGYTLPVDDFTIEFECGPHKESIVAVTDGPHTVVHGNKITIDYEGTHKALPIIKMEGVASVVTVGPFTITGLSGILYIDSPNQLVYSIAGTVKTNQMSKFSGNFSELNPGENEFPISGTITNLAITTYYRDTYK